MPILQRIQFSLDLDNAFKADNIGKCFEGIYLGMLLIAGKSQFSRNILTGKVFPHVTITRADLYAT